MIVPDLGAEPHVFHELTDEQFDRLWEQPMRAVVTEMIDAYRAGARRIVV